MPDWVPLNWAIAKNPLNWFIVFFMVVLPLIAISLVHNRYTAN